MSQAPATSELVDQLGALSVQGANIKKKMDDLKVQLIERGHGAHSGLFFDACVVASQRNDIDWKAVPRLLAFFLNRYRKASTTISVRVTARVQRKQAA